MSIFKQQQNGFTYWAVKSWQREGLHHGFIGADLDILQGKEQWQRFMGLDPGENDAQLALLNQVHGTEIVELISSDDYSRYAASFEEYFADAWIADLSNCSNGTSFSFGIKTADCIPVLARVKGSALVGAAHCGWKGAVAGLLPKLIDRLVELSGARELVELAFGPGAGPCCYEVSSEVTQEFEKALGKCSLNRGQGGPLSRVILRKDGREFCDIRALLTAQSRARNVESQQIFLVENCSICDKQFFSYRRQKFLSGRQLSFIGAHNLQKKA